MEGVWSTHFVMHFVSSLSWEGFCQHKWQDAISFLARNGGIMLTYVDTRRKAWEGFAQHRFSFLLCHRRHVRYSVNTSNDSFCVLASREGVCQQI
jgi:hypothetical protein